MRTLFLCTAFLALVVVGTGPADAQVKIDGLFFEGPRAPSSTSIRTPS